MNNPLPHKARKRFGQNFLHDPSVIGRIVDAINPSEEDFLLEIGPGLGALTAPLLQATKKMHAVEIDRDLIARLPTEMATHGDLTIHALDALKLNLRETFPEQTAIRVVGNLPYNISTPLLFHLCSQAKRIKDMHFMLQKEVVERMAAAPSTKGSGDKSYGRLSIMLQYHCKVVPLFIVKPGAFNPPPKVDSAIVRLIPHQQAPFDVGNYRQFSQLVSLAFSQRRKTLKNALSSVVNGQQFDAAEIDPNQRPEQLSPADYGTLARIISAA